MADTDTPSNCSNTDYTFYDENNKSIWNRGISRKIGESTFVQQTLPTYRLSWSPIKICPFFLILGVFFAGMGVGIKIYADSIEEITIPYTDCISFEKPTSTCAEVLNSSRANLKKGLYVDANDIENCSCRVEFQLLEPMNGTVYMHYALKNFYQNHLRYYSSRDENQLKGNLFDDDGDPKKPSDACGDFKEVTDSAGEKKIIYPCGLMANSMFTDVIDLYFHPPSTPNISSYQDAFSYDENEGSRVTPMRMELLVPLNRTGIAWESDKSDKYDFPAQFHNEKHPVWINFSKPLGWKKTLWQLDPHTNNFSNNGVRNEDFIVWMRAAAFPQSRKLYRIINSNFRPFENGLPAGDYSLLIQYRAVDLVSDYDVSSFDGEKSIILTTTSIVAGKNMFLAVVYMSTGALCCFLAIILFVVHKFALKSRTLALKDD
ncbi:Cell cycle control protein 50A [Orchesella cincta]|uniref:Cell cycle control protein 50A n=1 Tax=Orchesella cincta TaxID=48709 RepID=A0A1D2MLY1_ORCCI|nr:Cell cycle control protein 50A [Orchesella cincta]